MPGTPPDLSGLECSLPSEPYASQEQLNDETEDGCLESDGLTSRYVSASADLSMFVPAPKMRECVAQRT
jgi:hypothetical protein